MCIENIYTGGSRVPHGSATSLFPVDELPCAVVQSRDAQLQLEQLSPESVLTVTSDSMASGYFLAQHPLTLVPVLELPDDQWEDIDPSIDDCNRHQFDSEKAGSSS
jgi:hypothetical protein